jgi:hypothetical protein
MRSAPLFLKVPPDCLPLIACLGLDDLDRKSLAINKNY